MSRKLISLVLTFGLLFQQMGFAQVAGELNIASRMGLVGNSFNQDKFRPVHLRYFSYDNLSDRFKLLLDKGDALDLSEAATKETTKKLLNYFLVGIALPDSMFWVNLRPDSADQIIDPYLEMTDVGKIMLEADLQLKKDTASFTSPQTAAGKKYWNKLYQKAAQLYGTENVNIPTLTRPWIVPGEIIVRESAGSAYVYKANLKVMLEEDHLKDSSTYNFKDARAKALNEYSSQLIRELIIPQLTKEVNSAKRYAPLRQVYYSLILARWFKLRFSGKAGTYSALINSKNIQQLTSKEVWDKSSYFKKYQKSFAEGEYNVQEPVYTPTGQVIRSYFSGGIAVQGIQPDAFTTTTVGKSGVPVDFEAAAQIGDVDLKVSSSVVTANAAQAAVEELNSHRGLSQYDFKIENGKIVVRPKEQSTVLERWTMMLNNLLPERGYGVFIGQLDPQIRTRVSNIGVNSQAGLVSILKQIIDALGPAESLDQQVDLSKINADTVNSDAPSFVIEGRKLGLIKITGMGVSGQETLEVDLKRLRQEGVLIINLDQFIAEGSLVNQPELVDLFLKLMERKIHLAVISEHNRVEVTEMISVVLENARDQLIAQKIRADLLRFQDRFITYANDGTLRINFNDDLTPRSFTSISGEINPYVHSSIEEALEKFNFVVSDSWYKNKNQDSNLWRIDLGTKVDDLDQAQQTSEKVVNAEDGNVENFDTKSAVDALGGIDFRVLQMSIQPMGSFRGLEFKMPPLSAAELSKIDINVQMQQLKNMVKSGIIPSVMRVKELVAACLQKGQMNIQADSLLLCLADIFKLEEENALDSSPELREALVIVDSQS